MVAVGWAGALDPPEGTTDLVAVSNGDVEPSKANLGVTKSLDYEVQLKADGAAGTTLTLGYQKSGRKLPGIPAKEWANYLRAHRLPGTQLAPASKDTFTSLDDPTGVPTFGHFFQLRRGSRNVVLKTTMPQALRQVPAGDGEGPLWQYRLLVAKQADLMDTRATVSLTVPLGWRVIGSGGIVPRHRAASADHRGHDHGLPDHVAGGGPPVRRHPVAVVTVQQPINRITRSPA